MTQYWQSLTSLQQIFFIMAVPATLFLILQAVMSFFGADGFLDGMDIDTPGDVDVDAGGDVSTHQIGFFNLKAIIAFLVVGGWMGFFMAGENFSVLVAVLSAFISGLISLVLVTVIIRKLMGLQSSGNMNYDDAIGKNADVYLKIGPKSTDIGKITLVVSGRFSEFNAMTMGDKIFKTGEKVCVIDIGENGTFIVEEAV